jgi:alkanesulfonate monooxygenase SsuD/methylene tetrahydromethanopterin reductase-like flavin-dependent oxidoreductase (luciferase family)
MRFIRRADELGFDGMLFTEHHYGPNGGLTPSPLLLLAAASQVTERIKLVTMGIPLALHPHPVRVAEELALVDNLSRGRLVAGFISGGAPNLYAYNLSAHEERPRSREAFDLILRAWTDENPFEWHGECFDYECVSILPRPVQLPHPPLWTVAASAESLQWAAEHRLGLIASGSTEDAVERLTYYDTVAEGAGWKPTAAHRGIAREIYIGATAAEVQAKADEVFNREGQNAYDAVFHAPKLEDLHRELFAERSYGYRSKPRRAGKSERNPDAVVDGSYLVGDPDTLTREILRQRDACNAGVLIVRPELGAMTMDDVAARLQLFAREVLPNLKD